MRQATRLASERLLARNAVINLGGTAAPMLVALVAIPILIEALGTARFGVLTLVWVLIGYFGLFDLGLGRAVTKLVAERIGAGREADVPTLVWTALLVMLLLGSLGGALLAVLAPVLVGGVLNVPPELVAETRQSLGWAALSLPFVVGTTGLRGALEAHQRFGLVNAIRVPMGLFNYLGPLAVLPFSSSLPAVIAVLAAGRVLGLVLHLAACVRVIPPIRRPSVDLGGLRELLHFGGWITVSNVLGPLMSYMDRFLIGMLISVTAVAYYVTPFEMVSRLWIVPAALLGVLFPAFATTFASDRSRTEALYERAVRALLLVVFPITLILVVLASEGLQLWLGSEFAANSARVLQWLSVGVFINCLAFLPLAVVQGAGRPDITGKLHLLELPLYTAAILALSQAFGLEGIAMAWVLRVGVDTVVLFWMAERLLPTGGRLLWMAGRLAGPAVLALGLGFLPGTSTSRLAYLGVVLVLFAAAAWPSLRGLAGGVREPERQRPTLPYRRRSGRRALGTRDGLAEAPSPPTP